MKIQALNHYILVTLVDQREGLVVLPENSAPLNPYGLVLSIGEKVSHSILPGDKILFLPNGAIDMGNNQGFLIPNDCVLGKYVEENEIDRAIKDLHDSIAEFKQAN